MKSIVRIMELFKRENGDAVVEYALLIAFVSLALVAGAAALTGGINALFIQIGATLNGITIPSP